MNIGICDDNLNDLNELASAIKKYYANKDPLIKYQIYSYTDAIEFLNNYRANQFDILFLDIFLNSTNGFNIAQQIKKEEKTPIILYSSSKDFAIEGYQINIFGYLLKPLITNKLYTLLDKLHQGSRNKTVTLKKKGKDEVIITKNIIFVESKGRQIIIHTTKDEKLVFYESLDNFEKKLNSPMFLRTHKSYLVNMNKIISLNQRWFEVSNGEHVIIKIKEYKKIVQKYHDFIIKEKENDYF